MKTRLLALCVLVWLAGCAHEETTENAERAASGIPEKKLTVLFHANRHSELEPCGCSLNPTGGAEREFNYVSQVTSESKTPVFHFSAGTTFVPEPDVFSPKQIKFFQKKANFVVQALNQLSIKALAPSSNDFKLGVSELKRLEAASQFKWVLSNVVDAKTKKPIFTNHLLFKEGADEYLVLGLTGKPLKKFESNEVKLLSPTDVLQEFLGDARFAGKFVIVLSDLPKAEWEAMGALTSRVRLVLGGDTTFTTASDWVPMGSTTLYANPATRTKDYARLNLSWVEPIIGFYSEAFQRRWEFQKGAMELLHSEAREKLTEKLSKKAKAEWTEKLAQVEKAMAEFNAPAGGRQAGMAQVESSIVALDEKFVGPNALSTLVTQWQSEVRNIAVSGK